MSFNHYVLFYLKCMDNGGKNMTCVTDNEKVYNKYNEIWELENF